MYLSRVVLITFHLISSNFIKKGIYTHVSTSAFGYMHPFKAFSSHFLYLKTEELCFFLIKQMDICFTSKTPGWSIMMGASA